MCIHLLLIAKLVNISPITMVYDTQITMVFMGFMNQFITGVAPHCRVYRR